MGSILTNPPTLPNLVSDSWQPLVERDAVSYFGLNKVTLTNWDDTTTIPQVAQGSVIDIDGSLAVFAADEAIGGTPVDGPVYLKFVVSGSTVTPEFTAESPIWYADKAGWYNVAGERFSGHIIEKAGTAYSNKRQTDNSGPATITKGQGANFLPDGIQTSNKAFKMKFYSVSSSPNTTSTEIPMNLGSVTSTTIVGGIATTELNGSWSQQIYSMSDETRVGDKNIIIIQHTSTSNVFSVRFILFYVDNNA